MLTKLIIFGILILALIALGQSSRHRQAHAAQKQNGPRANREQLIVLWIGIGLLSLIGLYPPWMYTVQSRGDSGMVRMEREAGYHPLFSPPQPQSSDQSDSSAPYIDGVRLDFPRIAVQIVVVFLVTGGLFWTFRDRESRER